MKNKEGMMELAASSVVEFRLRITAKESIVFFFYCCLWVCFECFYWTEFMAERKLWKGKMVA